MRGDFDNIDELFSSELNDFAPAPPAQAWAGIESKLAAKKVKAPVFYLRRVAAAIAILFAGTAVTLYLNSDKDNTQTKQIAATVDSNSILDNAPAVVAKQQAAELANVEEVVHVETTPKSNLPVRAEQKNSEVPIVKEAEPIDANSAILASAVENNDENKLVVEEQEHVEKELLVARPAELSVQEKEEKIIYEPQKQDYSEEYKQFLAEFEEIDMPSDDRKKWAIGGQAGPQYAYRQLSSNDVAQELIDEYNNSEDGLMAYAGGINIAYKPARRLSIQSGVYYSKMGHSSPATPIEPVDYVVYDVAGLPGQEHILTNVGESSNNDPAQLRVSSSFGEVKQNKLSGDQGVDVREPAEVNSFSEVSSVEQYLEYIEVPLIARYAVIDRKINFHLLGGVSTNFLVASPVYLDNGTHYTDAQNLNKVNYSSTVGLGLGYKFSSFAISVEPQFKYYLNKVNTNASTDVHPYSFGVFTGVTYLF